MPEKLVFKNEINKIVVTDYRLMVENTSYSLRQIVSVSTYTNENIVSKITVDVDNTTEILVSRGCFLAAMLFCIVIGLSQGIWMIFAVFIGIACGWYWLTYPLLRTIPGNVYNTYHLDIAFSNGTMFRYEGDEKLVEKLGKVLNMSLVKTDKVNLDH